MSPKLSERLHPLIDNKKIRFLFFGAITAVFNIVLIALIIECFDLHSGLLRNVANWIAIEISVVFSFFVYRMWVWRIKSWDIRNILIKQLPKFHAASGAVILMRSLLIFPLLDWMHISYIVNTFLGIAVGAVANYVLTDQIVFKS